MVMSPERVKDIADRAEGINAAPEPRIGRPAKYKETFAKEAAKLCALGATDYELADFFEVDTRTIYRWKHIHEDFCQALIAGKENADARVERALYNRAVGYSFESEKVFQFQGEIIRAGTVEHVPPKPGAAKLWLTNRQPDKWREKQEVDHKSSDGSMTPTRIELVALKSNDSSAD